MKAKLIPAILGLLVQPLANLHSQQPQPGTLLWSYNTPYTVTACPAIAPDGTIYLGTQGALYAITNAGSNRWTFSVSVIGSPAVGTNNTIYFGGGSSTFYAVNPDGSQKWMYPLQPEFQYEVIYSSSPALGLDESVYFVASGRLYAFSSTGSNKWEYVIDNQSTPNRALSPVIGADGTIYVGSFYTRTLYAINLDGTKKWSLALDGGSGESPSIGANGILYVTGFYLNAISALGSNIWENTIPAEASPVIARDGTIYVENPNDTSLWSIKSNGQTNWSAVPTAVFHPPPPTTPAIDSSGMIYYCNSNSVYALNPQGQVQWVFAVPYGSGMSVPPTTISPAIGPDGTIYAAFGNTLYAIAGTNALGNTPWPMYRQNLRHTGKLEKPSLNQPKKRADAGFEFEMFGEVGQPYTIQRSTNLANWAVVTNFIASTQTTSVVDFTASNSPSRFYRALIQ